jgi:hypothetical protein
MTTVSDALATLDRANRPWQMMERNRKIMESVGVAAVDPRPNLVGIAPLTAQYQMPSLVPKLDQSAIGKLAGIQRHAERASLIPKLDHNALQKLAGVQQLRAERMAMPSLVPKLDHSALQKLAGVQQQQHAARMALVDFTGVRLAQRQHDWLGVGLGVRTHESALEMARQAAAIAQRMYDPSRNVTRLTARVSDALRLADIAGTGIARWNPSGDLSRFVGPEFTPAVATRGPVLEVVEAAPVVVEHDPEIANLLRAVLAAVREGAARTSPEARVLLWVATVFTVLQYADPNHVALHLLEDALRSYFRPPFCH